MNINASVVLHRENMGFPVVECDGEGQFIVTKPENTGGLVSWATVAEQVYHAHCGRHLPAT